MKSIGLLCCSRHKINWRFLLFLCLYLVFLLGHGVSISPGRCGFWEGLDNFLFLRLLERTGGMKWRGGGMRGKGGIRGWRQEQGGGAAPLLLLLQCFTTSIPLCSTQSCTVSRSSAPLGFPVKQPYTEYDTLTVHCSSREHADTQHHGASYAYSSRGAL